MSHDPLWMSDQIVYQIFPDRFAIGQPHTSESKLAGADYHVGDYARRRWHELPEMPSRGKDFFGGDLGGICDRLDYLQALGVTCVYLTPIFTAPSNHKYDTTDFLAIDPQFGGEAALAALITALKRRNMRLVLDAVLNHVSDLHPWFQAAKRGKQPYREFFTWPAKGRYECWRGFRHMPELNLDSEALQDLLFRRPDSVLQKYLALGIDAWRFDVAVDVGLPTVRAIRRVIDQSFPGTMLLGEVMSYGGTWCGTGDTFHGVMNYWFRDAVMYWLRGEIPTGQVQRAMQDYATGYGDAGAVCSWNMLSSHDTPRLRHSVPDAALRRLAVVAQFTLPGVPFIYYGEENGMDGGDDPDCRRPMIWAEDRWDRATRSLYQQLIGIRQTHPALRRGTLTLLDADALVFLRDTGEVGETVLVAINPSAMPYRQIVFTRHPHLYHSLPLRNLLDPAESVTMAAGNLRLELPPKSAAIYVPDDSRIPDYRFLKERNLRSNRDRR